jgi:hypothetical protein
VFASEEGFSEEASDSGALDRLAKAGRRVLAIDVRGMGETRQTNQEGMTAAVGRDYWDFYTAYSLGRTFVGMQAEDLIIAAGEAQRRSESERVDIIAVGSAGVPALHAAYCEPAEFRQVTLDGMLSSWDAVVRADSTFGQLMSVVHGALKTYDLPDLAAALRTAVTIRSSAGPTGMDLERIALTAEDRLPSRPGLTGVRFGSPNFVNILAVDGISGGVQTWDVSRGHDWSARWTGFLVPEVSGELAFAVETNEEVIVEIGDNLSMRATSGKNGAAASVPLRAGQAVAICVHFNKPRREAELDDHVSKLSIRWRDAGGGWHSLPESWLRHSRAQRQHAEMSLR